MTLSLRHFGRHRQETYEPTELTSVSEADASDAKLIRENEAYKQHQRSVGLRWLAGGAVAAVATVGIFTFVRHHEGLDGTIVPKPLTPAEKYQALTLDFATADNLSSPMNAISTLSTVLNNELYGMEHGSMDGYRAAFAQAGQDNFGNFQSRVNYDRQVSSTLVAQHALHSNYPTQSVDIVNLGNIDRPALDGSVTIGAEVEYHYNHPTANGTPQSGTETLKGSYTLVKQEVTDFSDGIPRDIWVLQSQNVAQATQR